jgi:hypothetical protein
MIAQEGVGMGNGEWGMEKSQGGIKTGVWGVEYRED